MNKRVWLSVAGVILGATGITVGILLGTMANNAPSKEEEEFSLPERLEEEWWGEAEAGDGQVVIPGQGNLTIMSAGKIVDANFCNPNGNSGRYLMMFAIVLEAKKSEAIYVSEPIKAGECAGEVVVSSDLISDAEEISAKILIQPYRIEDGIRTNNVNAKVKIIKSSNY